MRGLRIWTVQQNSALRACPPVLSMWSCNIFLTSKFSYSLFFCNPTNKTETGTADMWELLIENHLDQSLYLPNQKQGAPVRSYLLHSSVASAQLCWAFYQPLQTEHICKLSTYAGAKPFSWVKRVCFQFSSFDLNVEGHILSTGGDGLRYMKLWPADINSSFQTLLLQ
jgi:hypothetical protein